MPDLLSQLSASILNPEQMLTTLGPYALAGVIFIIFAETGLLIGFFLPGDSLLFITGMFVAQGFISTNILVVCLLLTAAAILGNMTGYWIGFKSGPRLFNKPDSRFFKRGVRHQDARFFEKYGNKAIVLARFVPMCGRSSRPSRGGAHELPALRRLLGHRRCAVGDRRHAAGVLPGQHPVREEQHRDHPHPGGAGVGGADRHRVPAAPA